MQKGITACGYHVAIDAHYRAVRLKTVLAISERWQQAALDRAVKAVLGLPQTPKAKVLGPDQGGLVALYLAEWDAAVTAVQKAQNAVDHLLKPKKDALNFLMPARASLTDLQLKFIGKAQQMFDARIRLLEAVHSQSDVVDEAVLRLMSRKMQVKILKDYLRTHEKLTKQIGKDRRALNDAILRDAKEKAKKVSERAAQGISEDSAYGVNLTNSSRIAALGSIEEKRINEGTRLKRRLDDLTASIARKPF